MNSRHDSVESALPLIALEPLSRPAARGDLPSSSGINGTHAYATRQIGLFFSANADEVPIQVVNNKIGKGVLVARGNIILKRYPLVT
jgi:hypothetical protein